mgnify:CR=1 FL=1
MRCYLNCILTLEHPKLTPEHFYLGTYQADPGTKKNFALRAAILFPGRSQVTIRLCEVPTISLHVFESYHKIYALPVPFYACIVYCFPFQVMGKCCKKKTENIIMQQQVKYQFSIINNEKLLVLPYPTNMAFHYFLGSRLLDWGAV